MTNELPLYKLTMSELVDKLTISQLRELILNTTDYEEEIRQFEHDIDLKIGIPVARDFRIIFLIAVTNALIWASKENMKREPEKYDEHLRVSHMWNGLKNQLKNMLDDKFEKSKAKRTNIETDGLDYHLSL